MSSIYWKICVVLCAVIALGSWLSSDEKMLTSQVPSQQKVQKKIETPQVRIQEQIKKINTKLKKKTQSGGYTVLKELAITGESQTYEVAISEAQSKSLSFMFIGSDGEVLVKNVQVEFMGKPNVVAPDLEKKYFPGDWYRFESEGKKVGRFRFQAEALNGNGKLAIYSQNAY